MKNNILSQKSNSLIEPAVLAKLSRLTLSPRTIVEGTFSGIHKSHNKGSSIEFAQYRKYSPGDDITKLDWKILARTDRFFVKEFDADTNMRCHFILDCSNSMNFKNKFGESKIQIAKKMAATLAYITIMQGDAAGLQCFNEKFLSDIPAKNNPAHLKNILDSLNSIQAHGKTQLVNVLHSIAEKIRRRALLILFSDLFSDDIKNIIDCFHHMRHRKHDLAVFHLIDSQELNFSFDRPIRFLDMESSAFIQSDPALIRNIYLTEFNNFLQSIRMACLEFHIDYRFTDTSIPYDEHLQNFILSRMKKKHN